MELLPVFKTGLESEYLQYNNASLDEEHQNNHIIHKRCLINRNSLSINRS